MLPDAAVEALVDDLVEEAADRLLEDYKDLSVVLSTLFPLNRLLSISGLRSRDNKRGTVCDPKFLGGIFGDQYDFVNAC